MLYGWPQAFRLARVVAARWWLGLETPWSESVSEVVGGRGGEQFLPVAVALAWRSSWELAGQRHLRVVVGGGTGNAWANPQPAETPRRLVLGGGFVVDGGRDRHLEECVRALGFNDLRGYLQSRCDVGDSVPRIATELGVSDWQVQAALTRVSIRLAPRPQRLAAQRRRYTEERIAARVAGMGFADVRVYLADRVGERGWLLAEVAAELAAHRLAVRRLLDRYGIRRVRRTPASGRRLGWDVGCRRWGGDATYRRLVSLKDRHDPDNVFRLNHNIPLSTIGTAAGVPKPAGTPG
jgi:Berberine and berberine like